MIEDKPMNEILDDAERLHAQSMKLLAGILLKGRPVPEGMTREEAIAILKEDIIGSRKLLKKFGREVD